VNMHTTIKGANGILPLDLGWAGAKTFVHIFGGPFDNFPGRDQAFGVCVRSEMVPDQRDVHLPINDFSVPSDAKAVEYALTDTFDAAIDGKTVYVGCMGGWGRTGLFLALMAKAAGVADPVTYVREHYTPKAVETREQKAYVAKFDVTNVRRHIAKKAWRKKVPVLGGLIARLFA
jgi:hypothetical protein